MKSRYKIGDIVHAVDIRNSDLKCDNLLGLSMTKEFRPSTSNIVGTDLSKYKVVHFNEFAVDFMSAIRVHKMPIALNRTGDDIIVSPAYGVFAVNNENQVLPEYLMMWFSRPEFDRYADFKSDSAIRGGYDWHELCNTDVTFPSIDEQLMIVHDYQVITDRIALLRKINEKLEIYADLRFGDFFKNVSGNEGFFSDVIKIMGGGTPSTTVNEYWNGHIPFFTPGDIEGVFCFTTAKTLTDKGITNCSSKKYPSKTSFITCRGTVGKVAMAGVPMAMNQTCYALTGNGDYPEYFVYEFTKYFVESIKRKANGGVFDAITIKDFESEKTIVPSTMEAKKYEDVVKPIFNIIFQHEREMSALQKMRSILMSKCGKGA